MKIELASHSGFCMGVRNAVQKIVNIINTSGETIQVYGPLIHNPQTIDILSRRGLKTIHSLDGISGGNIAIRTHGIPFHEYRKIRKEAARVINLTCPRVAKVQAIIKKFASRGYFTVITGDDHHAEVIGLKSYASAGVSVISSPAEAGALNLPDKTLLVSQTTLERETFEQITAVLKKKLPAIEIVNTICDSTRYRQSDVIEGIKKGADTMVVVGGKNSANTRRLARIGEEAGIRTIYVETADELDENDFRDSDYVLVTAGASTPGWVINNAMERLYAFKFRKSNFLLNILKRILEFSVRSHLVSSLAAFFMTLIVQSAAGIQRDLKLALVSLLYIFSMYSINNYFDRAFLKESNSYKYAIYGRFGSLYFGLSLACIALSGWLTYGYGLAASTILGLSYFLGLVYSTGPVRALVQKAGLIMKRAYNTKIIATIGWLVPLLLLPYIIYSPPILPMISVGTAIFTIILFRQTLMDVIAIQGDVIFGRDTIPVLFGIERTFIMLSALASAASLLMCIAASWSGRWQTLFLVLNIAYYIALFRHISRLRYLIALKYEVIVDFNYFLLIIFYCLLFFPVNF